MTSYGILSVLPATVAILLAFWIKRINAALLAGVVVAIVLLNPQAPWLAPFRSLDYMVRVAIDPDNFMLIAFSLLVGGLLKLIRDANGFQAFSDAIARARKGYGKGTVFGLTYVLGTVIFLECWSNILITGTTLAPLYDKLGISRARLAYFVHTVGLNMVAMLVINGWGAFYMTLLSAQQIDRPFQLIVSALPFNLYGWASLGMVAFVMATGLTIGPMREAEAATRAAIENEGTETASAEPAQPAGPEPRLSYMLVPILTLIVTMLTSLYLTGNGDITRGAGTASILYASALATMALAALLLVKRVFSFGEIEDRIVGGMQEFFDISLLIVFALSLGELSKDLGTGEYMSRLVSESLPIFLLPVIIFLLGALMSFATGTSYGTLAIMVPIVLPMAGATGYDPALLFGVCLSGAVFGDNTSPVNDNSIITSMATKVSVIDHVRTQMPYALIAAGVSAIGFVIVGLLFAR